MGSDSAIAELQQLLQSAEHTTLFKFPPGVSVLHWTYREEVVDRYMFQAVLGFLCNGVPHHVAGDWHPSKRNARHSAADVGVSLMKAIMINKAEGEAPPRANVDLASVLLAASHELGSPADMVRKLEALLDECAAVTAPGREWRLVQSQRRSKWFAFLVIELMGVLFTFSGPVYSDIEEAKGELAKRVMWYMGYSGLQGCYLPNKRLLLSNRCQVSQAPLAWMESLDGHP